MSDRRNAAGLLVAALLVLLGVVIALAVNAIYGYLPSAVTGNEPLWIGLLAAATATTSVLTWRSSRSGESDISDASWWMLPVTPGWVDRPELAELVFALTAPQAGAVVTTTGLIGAGGFGKTTLAVRACHDEAIRRRFSGVVWITVGRQLDAPALAARISETLRNLGVDGPVFTSSEEAGKALGAVLAARGRVLLVADDVWTAEQLEPFTIASGQGRLLVTTRRAQLLARAVVHQVKVDAVTEPVAKVMLTQGVPAMPSQAVQELLRLAGGWPLLLTLIHDRLALDATRPGGSIEVAATEAIAQLREVGPAALDIADETSRQLAVDATVRYSLDALPAADRERFFELAIFAGAQVPMATLALLWQRTAGMDAPRVMALCGALDGLSLATLAWSNGMRVLVLHDVIHDLATRRLSPTKTVTTHQALIEAARDLLAKADPPAELAQPPATVRRPSAVAASLWWRLPQTDAAAYLWRYLTYHLREAGLTCELDRVCADLRFVAAKLVLSGPAAIEADLARSNAPLAEQLRHAIAQNAHLLAPMEPPAALTTTLTSRLGHIRKAAAQLEELRSGLDAWTAWPLWPMPDQADDVLIRAIGHVGDVTTVAIAPSGTWLAAGSRDGTVRTWDVNGAVLSEVKGHERGVTAVAIAPDGRWLATAGWDGSVRIWNLGGDLVRELKGHKGGVSAVAIASDGSQVVASGHDGSVRIWDVTGALLRKFACPEGGADSVAIAPDGTWLATGGIDGTTRIWDAAGSLRSQVKNYRQAVHSMAIAPDSTWLATGHDRGGVRIWDSAGSLHHELHYYGSGVICLAIAPDGSWFGAGGHDGSARIWSADRSLLHELDGDQRWAHAMAIAPDGTFVAASFGDETVRILRMGRDSPREQGHRLREVKMIAIAPDGTWLATGRKEGTVWIWNADGSLRHEFSSRHALRALVAAPDGTWLATGGWDGIVRTWETNGSLLHEFQASEYGVPTMAVTPDGTRIVTGDGMVRIWDTRGSLIREFGIQRRSVESVAMAPDGTWIVTGDQNGSVQIWDVDGSLMHQLDAGQRAIRDLAIAPSGDWLATRSLDGTLRIWDAHGSLMRQLEASQMAGRGLAIAPDGNWLATAHAGGTVRIWDVRTEFKCVTAIRIDDLLRPCEWFPTGMRLCVGGNRGLYVFSLEPPA